MIPNQPIPRSDLSRKASAFKRNNLSPYTLSTLPNNLLLRFLFILSLSTGVINAQANAKSAADCTPGFLFCEFFGCIQEPICPRLCETIADENSCTKSASGIGCKWERGLCSRNVQCSAHSSTCSNDCMNCGAFGCVPKSSQCPQACALYSSQGQCSNAPKIGPVSCAWSDNRCTTSDDELNATSTKDSPKPSESSSDPSEDDPDFGTTLSKRSWASTVGIIVGVLFGVLGILGISLLLWHRARERRRRLQNEAALDSNQPNRYRPHAFLQSLRSVVDRNAKELDAVPPLTPLPPTRPL